MKNSSYWEQRVANKTWNIYNSLEERNRALEEIYQEAYLNIEEELYKIAKKIETGTPTLSDMHKYNRLGKLKDNINDTLKQLGKEIEKRTTNQITKAFIENYNNTMKELGELEYTLPNKKFIESLLKFPWSGENFSSRLWENTRVLERNLNEILTRGLVQGKTIFEMATQLEERMMKGFDEAHRLVRTETMHYLNESSLRAYMDSGVKKVQLWAALDERTCPKCGVKHGNPYSLKDAPVLPLHANCRCTYLPVIDLDNKKGDNDINDAKDFDELEASLRDILKINITNDIRMLDFEAIKSTCVSMKKVFDEFPSIKGFVKEICTSKSGMMACAPTDISFNMTRISFNPSYYKDVNKIKNIYLKDAISGFHPRGTTYEISGIHELGHAVEAYLINSEGLKYDAQKAAYWKECTVAKSIVSKACKNAKKLSEGKGLSNAELKENISGYALSDASECMAEAFSDYFGNKDKASILSKEIIKIVKEMMS